MPKNWNLGLISKNSEFVEIQDEATIEYNPLSKLIETHLHHESGVRAKSMFETFSNEFIVHSKEQQRQRFLDSLTSFEIEIFEEVAYPNGLNILYVTIEDIMKKQLGTIDAQRADTPEFIDVIRRNS